MKRSILAATLVLACGNLSIAADAVAAPPIKVEKAEKHLAKGIQLLDVRTPQEWKEGHLKGAILVPVTEDGFLAKAQAALDPKAPVLVYCRSGKRSAAAAKQLRNAGFTVHDLAGGILAWEAAGKPVVKSGN